VTAKGGHLEIRAELDVPGETGRQTRVFLIWAGCLALAIVVGSIVRGRVPLPGVDSPRAEAELAEGTSRRARAGILLGLVLPTILTVVLNHRRKRGGAHARGIVVDVTPDGELRVWGRGYGTRVSLEGADVGERLVDVYAGRLGAWRQRRLRVRARGKPGLAAEIEIATVGESGDAAEGLKVEGGEGDCVEIGREDYERLRAVVKARAMASPASSRASAAEDVGDGDA
jgi:hypothetical protein